MSKHIDMNTAYEKQLYLGEKAYNIQDWNLAFYYLENAHVLGQKNIEKHIYCHFWMLKIGIRKNDYREVLGQLFRIFGSLIFTIIWVPKGNTGGSNVSAIKIMPIRAEIQKYFK